MAGLSQQLNINLNMSGMEAANSQLQQLNKQLITVNQNGQKIGTISGGKFTSVPTGMGAALTGINQKVTDMYNGLIKTSNEFKNFGRNIQWSGQRLTYGLSVPLAGAVAVVTKSALDFDQAMAGVRAAVSETTVLSETDYNKIKSSVLDMSKTSVKSSTDIAGGLYELVSAGYDVNDAIAMMPQVLDFATASMQDTGTAAQFSARMYAAWNNTGITLGQIMDTTSIAVQKSNAHWSDFSHNMEMSTQFAKQAGLSYQELSAVIATLSDKGAVLGRLGFSISNMMQKIYAPTDKAKNTLKELDMSFYDNNHNMKNFGSIMTELSTKIKGYNEESQARIANEIFGIQADRAALPFLDDLAKSYDEMNNKMQNATGTTQRMAEAIKQSPWGMYQIAVNGLNAQMITLGNITLPIVTKLISAITNAIAFSIGVWNALSPSIQNIIKGIGMFVIVAGPTLVILGLLVEAIGLLMNPISWVISGFMLLGAVIGAFALSGKTSFNDIKKSATDFSKTISESVANVEADMNNGSANYEDNAKQIQKATKQMQQQLEDLDRQINKTEYNFKESLAEMVKSHKDALKDFQSQLDEENTSFSQSQQEKLDSFQEKTGEMNKEHTKRLNDLNKELQQEIQKGRKADATQVADLKSRIAEENSDFADQTLKNNIEYQKDTTNAKTEHDKKLADLQIKLDAEKTILSNHSAEVLAVKDFQYRDEFQKLVDSHTEQMAEYDRQKVRINENFSEQMSGMVDTTSNAFDKILQKSKDTNSEIEKSTTESVKITSKSYVENLFDKIAEGWGILKEYLADPETIRFSDWIRQKTQNPVAPSYVSDYIKHSGGLLHAQSGMLIGGSSPMRDRVSVMAEQGEGIMSKKAVENILRNGTTGGDSYNINVEIKAGTMIATPGEQREFARKLHNIITQDLSVRQGVTI